MNNSAVLNAYEWYNEGFITINSGGALNNGVAHLISLGGGQILVNSGGTLNANSDGQGETLDLQGSLLTNNGTVTGTTNIEYGSTAQGSGKFGPINVSEGGTLDIACSADFAATSLAVSGSIVGAGQSAVPMTVAGATINTPNRTDVLTLSGNLSGAGPLTKEGEGLLILSGENSYGEGTIVSSGTLEVCDRLNLPPGTSLIVGQDASLPFNPATQAAPAAGDVRGVPEPSTLALFAAGLAVWFVGFRREKRRCIMPKSQ